MPVLEQSENFERVHIPPRRYPAKLVSIREAEIADFDDKSKMQKVLFWAFEIAGKTSTVTVEGMTTFAFGEKSKARKWIKAMLGSEPPKTFDTDDLLGMTCEIVVGDRPDKEGNPYSRVEDILPRGGDEEPLF